MAGEVLVSIAFRLLSHFLRFRSPERKGCEVHPSQLPFGFCLTFYSNEVGVKHWLRDALSQLPFGFCLTFYRVSFR